MPTGTAIISITTSDAPPSTSERPSAVNIAGPTGWLVRIEVPKSPCGKPDSQRQYCSQAGSPSPSRSRTAANACGVAFSPSRVTAASAGRICVNPNTMIDTTSSV